MANQLPSDDLCVENAIMLRRFNRYPLIIDPSGQATEFIMNEYKDKKITKTRCVVFKVQRLESSILKCDHSFNEPRKTLQVEQFLVQEISCVENCNAAFIKCVISTFSEEASMISITSFVL